MVAKCWCQAYKFWGTIVEMGSERFENVALQTSWVMHRELGRGWVHDMISVFIRIGFSQSMEDSLTMQTWDASDIKSNYVNFKEKVEEFFIEKMMVELLAANSKYYFLAEIYSGNFPPA